MYLYVFLAKLRFSLSHFKSHRCSRFKEKFLKVFFPPNFVLCFFIFKLKNVCSDTFLINRILIPQTTFFKLFWIAKSSFSFQVKRSELEPTTFRCDDHCTTTVSYLSRRDSNSNTLGLRSMPTTEPSHIRLPLTFTFIISIHWISSQMV